MSYVVVIYEYRPERADAQLELRPQHREFLGSLQKEGLLVAAGAWPDTGEDPGALLLFNSEDPDAILATLDKDPYLQNDVIARRRAHCWQPAVGQL